MKNPHFGGKITSREVKKEGLKIGDFPGIYRRFRDGDPENEVKCPSKEPKNHQKEGKTTFSPFRGSTYLFLVDFSAFWCSTVGTRHLILRNHRWNREIVGRSQESGTFLTPEK